MVQSLNIAIVGCGWAGIRHALSCKVYGADVGYAVDLDLGRADKCRKALGPAGVATKITTDYADVLHDQSINAVSLCVPHNLHALMAIKAANGGKHILVEKPLAANLQQANLMIESAKSAGVILMVAENVRFSPIYRKMGDYLRDDIIGAPAMIQITRQAYLRESFIRERPWFLDAEKAAGGIMMSGGIHDFEAMRMLIGEVESVFSLRAPQRFVEMEGDDTSAALIKFRNGVIGTLVESFIIKRMRTAAGSEVHTLRIDGVKGSIAWDGGRTIRVFTENPVGKLDDHLSAQDVYIPDEDTFVQILSHFTNCISTGQEPVTSGRSQYHALAAVEAAYRSMERGEPVFVDNILSDQYQVS